MRLLIALLMTLVAPLASADRWSQTLLEARGQTVYFNAWGGSEVINQYIARVAQTLASEYQIQLVHVKVDDIAAVIARLDTERRARASQGSTDLLWVNGENFSRLKQEGLLGEPFVDALPNAQFLDPNDVTLFNDFSIPTDGLEAPWGRARLVFLHDTSVLPAPPTSLEEMLSFALENPGRVSYPKPPNFHGTTFLKHVLLKTAPNPDVLAAPVTPTAFAEQTASLWNFLDRLHPVAWRQGRQFPDSAEGMMQLLADGELAIALSFNPNDAANQIALGRLPETVRTHIHQGGTLGNTHFLAIPLNARARAAALVTINALLSPRWQADKANPEVWGDPTVLDMRRLDSDARAIFAALPISPAVLRADQLGPALPEPHASWTEPLEATWRARYLTQ